MPNDTSVAAQLATAMLPHVIDPETAGVVLAISNSDDVFEMRACPDDALALNLAREGWRKAAMLAMATSSPQVLAKLAKDGRINVRRAVAGNVNCDEATREYLLGWAMANKDKETIAGLLRHLPAGRILAVIDGLDRPTRQDMRQSLWDSAADGIARDGSARAFLDAADAGHPALIAALAPRFAAARPVGASLTELVDKVQDTRVAATVVAVAKAQMPQLDAEFATLMARHTGLYQANAYNAHCDRLVRAGHAGITDEAVRILLDTGDDAMRQCVAASAAGTRFVAELLEDPPCVIEELVGNHLAVLTEEHTERLAETIAAYGQSPWSAASVLAHTTHTLSTPALLRLMRVAGLESTQAWLAGRVAHQQPRPGEVRALVADPGNAFGYSRHVETALDRQRYVMEKVLWDLPDLFVLPWGDELADSLGPVLFEAAVRNTNISPYIERRMRRAFGASPELWRTAFGLLDGWEASLTELVETTCVALGAPLVAAGAPVDIRGEQLDLFTL